MAIANGTCVSFCNQPIGLKAHYLATSRESRRYVIAFSRIAGGSIWLRQESLRHILASPGYIDGKRIQCLSNAPQHVSSVTNWPRLWPTGQITDLLAPRHEPAPWGQCTQAYDSSPNWWTSETATKTQEQTEEVYKYVYTHRHRQIYTDIQLETHTHTHLRSVSTTRVHGPCTRASCFHYPSSRPELTGVKKCTRVLGPSTRPVNSGSGNRP